MKMSLLEVLLRMVVKEFVGSCVVDVEMIGCQVCLVELRVVSGL